MKQIPLSVSLVVLFYSFSVSAAELQKVDKYNYKMRPGGFVTVIGDNGYISVEAWEKSEVEVVITKKVWDRNKRRAEEKLEDIAIDIDQRDDRLVIRYLDDERNNDFHFLELLNPDKWREHQSPQVDFELRVPHEIDLRLENDEGDITVTGTNGDMELDIDEGELRIDDVVFTHADIVIDEGNIKFTNFHAQDGKINIEADEGDVLLEDGSVEKLDVEVDEGDITIQNVIMANCDISSDEGDLEIDLNPVKEGDYAMSANEGDIRIWMASEPDIALDLQTEEGTIRGDFRLNRERKVDDNERVRQVLGRGEARLEVFTEEGNIILNKR